MSKRIVVWWIKRDARLLDNGPLTEAARINALVLPIFCFEPSVMSAADSSAMHHHAQSQAVSHLRDQLRERNADLVLAQGEVVEKLEKLRSHVPFTHLFAHEEIGNDLTYQRDRAVAAWCGRHGVVYREFPQSSVRRAGVDRDRLQAMWQARIVQSRPLAIPEIEQSPEILQLAKRTHAPKFEWPPSARAWQAVTEADAHATLDDFLDRRGLWYRGGISSPNTAVTAGSRLSVHLAWGTITARQVWHATRKRIDELDRDDEPSKRWRSSLEAFLSRLHWRDHFVQRLESEPELEFRSIHPAYREIGYTDDEHLHTAWREGRTGFPMVDAVMRCLAATGFVNFRMRAMVVSFACHALHLDWRLIHPYLASVFRDYDPGIHLSQLQMQAGVVGWNAIRVYNPGKQLVDWDSRCRFVRRWLPELRMFSAEQIVQGDMRASAEYPPPIVDFASRTQQMKDMLYQIRQSAEAKAATAAVYARHGSRMKMTKFKSVRKARSRRTHNENPAQRTLFD